MCQSVFEMLSVCYTYQELIESEYILLQIDCLDFGSTITRPGKGPGLHCISRITHQYSARTILVMHGNSLNLEVSSLAYQKMFDSCIRVAALRWYLDLRHVPLHDNSLPFTNSWVSK